MAKFPESAFSAFFCWNALMMNKFQIEDKKCYRAVTVKGLFAFCVLMISFVYLSWLTIDYSNFHSLKPVTKHSFKAWNKKFDLSIFQYNSSKTFPATRKMLDCILVQCAIQPTSTPNSQIQQNNAPITFTFYLLTVWQNIL